MAGESGSCAVFRDEHTCCFTKVHPRSQDLASKGKSCKDWDVLTLEVTLRCHSSGVPEESTAEKRGMDTSSQRSLARLSLEGRHPEAGMPRRPHAEGALGDTCHHSKYRDHAGS